MNAEVALKIGGGIFVVAGAACLIYVILSQKKDHPDVVYSSEYDDFADYTLENGKAAPGSVSTIQECKDACTADDKCRGAVFNYNSHSCMLSREDPFETALAATPDSHVLIRRLKDQPESKWYDWAPKKCPANGVQTRMCVGSKPRCLGDATRKCTPEINYGYDAFEAVRVDA